MATMAENDWNYPEMAAIGYKQLNIVGNGCKLLTWLELAEMPKNGWKWLEMALKGKKQLEWLKMVVNSWKRLDIVGNGQKWLEWLEWLQADLYTKKPFW